MTDYERGLNDAWGAAKKIILMEPSGFSLIQMDEVFGTVSPAEVFKKHTVAEAIAKIEAYEEKKKSEDEILVGDEVKNGFAFGVVTDVNEDILYGIRSGALSFQCNKEDVTKTGRHFPEVVELLEKMKEGKE